MREILSAASAAGISVAFGAPIGGVVFSLEEMSYYFSSDTMWHSFFCAMAAAVALKLMDPFRTEKLVVFQVQYNRDWHGFEMMFYLMLGILGVRRLLIASMVFLQVCRILYSLPSFL